jgi:hypothetical protein
MCVRNADGELVPKLCGEDSGIWGTTMKPDNQDYDLVCPAGPDEEDLFSNWFLEKAMKAFFACNLHRYRKPHKVRGDIFYQRKKVLQITYYITPVLASLLLVLSIVVLWKVTSMAARLALIAVFNLTVSVSVIVFTRAPRSQVFTIAARYVQTANGNSFSLICGQFRSRASGLC